jgi:hypothetical protein
MIRNRIARTLQLAAAVSLFGGEVEFSNTNGCFDWGSLLYAQTPQYPYKRYENRKEGLVRSKQFVAGEKLVLLSAAIENNEAMPKTSFDKYRLVFCLPETSQVKILVREFEKVYKDVKMEYRMEPLQNEYPAGTNQFSWPAEIPLYYKLTIDDLVPLATAPGSEFDTIVPLLLFYAAPMNSAVSYRFCFFPLQTINVLEYKIYRANPLALIYSDKLRDLPGEQKIHLRWPGKDQNNKPAGSGLYNLVIEATFRALPGTNAKKLTTTYQFYHDIEIIKRSQARP